MSTRLERRALTKTTAYTLKPAYGDRSGLTFSNRGAGGSVTFTLPAPATALIGWWYEFVVHAAQSVVVAGAAAGDLCAPGNAAADNVGFQVANQKIGGRIIVICDGTQWHAHGLRAGGGFCVNGTEVALSVGGTALTATAAELNALAGVTAGTAAASKAVVLDASKAVAGLLVALGAALPATLAGGNVGDVTDSSTTASGTTQTTYYPLNSIILPANALSANGKAVIVATWGVLAGNANAKDIKLTIGASTIVTTTGLTDNAKTYLVLVLIVRTAAGHQTAVGLLISDTAIKATTYSDPAVDETTALTIALSTQNTAAAAASATGRGMALLFLN